MFAPVTTLAAVVYDFLLPRSMATLYLSYIARFRFIRPTPVGATLPPGVPPSTVRKAFMEFLYATV